MELEYNPLYPVNFEEVLSILMNENITFFILLLLQLIHE